MRIFAIFAICILQVILVTVRAEGHYSIIAPGTIHPKHKYNVAVTVHDVTEPVQLKLGVIGPDYDNLKTVELKPNEVQNIEFDIPDLPKLEDEKQSYNLTAEGLTGIVFKNTTKLNYQRFHPLVKIQTDKGKYKPGDLVNFRVVFLDENLLPLSELPKESYVWIEDDKRNRIKEFKDIKLVKGVYTGQFQLSEFAILGYWRIIAKTGEPYYNPEASFDVEKYVLPKYTIKVEATEDVSARDGDMQVVVRANYTYGKPVNGKVTLVIDMNNYYYFRDEEKKPSPPKTIKVTDMVEGKAKFDLNIKEYAEYMPSNKSSYGANILATVEENFTGVQINGSAYSRFYPYRYSINCATWYTCSTFHAGKEEDIVIKVTYVDNSKVDDTKSVVRLTYTEILKKYQYYGRAFDDKKEEETTTPAPFSDNKVLVFESHLNETSFANFKVKLEDLPEYEGYNHYYQMKAEFIDETHELYSAHQYREPKKLDREPAEPVKLPTYWFSANVQRPEKKWSLDLNKEATVALNCSIPMNWFVYHIIGRGNILKSVRVDLPEPAKLHNFTITPDFYMAPHSNIYIFFVDDNGEFRYAEDSFSVEVELRNQIEVTAPEQVKPGDEVSLKIKTAPHSFVGLTAIDQSVLLLKENNDFRPDDYRWQLGGYGTSTPWQGGYSYYPGERSGVVTLTNADYFYNWTEPEYKTYNRMHGVVQENAILKSQAADIPTTPVGAAGFAAVGASGQRGGFDASQVKIRKDFAETWLFADIEDTQTEEFTWNSKIPDTVTSWVISAFSLNPEKGIGVLKERTKVKTFQPFFISIRLPYSVKRGEVINVPALVFNYLEKDLDVDVTLENTDGEYEFTEVSNDVINEPKRTKSVTVPANSARGVSFMLRPKVIGNVMLKFTALSPIAGDAIHKTMKVVPEGVTKYANRAYFVNLKDTDEFKDSFELDMSGEVVPDSQHIEFAVVGDLLGPLLNNLENLVRLPLGCGEQVTSAMAPNLIVLEYLKKTNQLKSTVENKLQRNLETGYQRLLSYRNEDGSFSAFSWLRSPHEKTNGSTWLTSYVVRALNHVADHIKVDPKILSEGLEFLSKRQAENGSFLELGDYFFRNEDQYLTRTAQVLLAFVENKDSASKYQSVIDRGFKYLVENVDKNDDLYNKALVTYVLHVAKQSGVQERVAKLKAIAKTDEDRMWWSKHDHDNKLWWRWTYSSDVETTAYILLVLLDMEEENVQTVLPIIKWLVSKRNSFGGFSTTQDTVVGLHAITKFALRSGYEPGKMDVDFKSHGPNEKSDVVKVNEENSLLYQTVELPAKSTSVDFHAKGKGAALVQVAYQYNILEKEKQPSFSIKIVVNKETPAFKLELDVCVQYTGEGEASNMAILEVPLPSGYVADTEGFEQIEKVENVRLVETKHKESVIEIYFDSLHKEELKCLPISAFKQHAVALLKPVPVVLYDYYDTSRKATEYYEVSSKLCDICEDDEECKKACH